MKISTKNTLSGTPHLALAIALLGSANAFAQFTVVEQRALLTASATSQFSSTAVTPPDFPVQTASQYASISPTDLTGKDLTAEAKVENDFLVSAEASLRTTATSSVVGLSDQIQLTFQQQVSTLGDNLTVAGKVSVKASLTFDVDAPTEVSIATLLPTSPFVTALSRYSNWTLFAADKGAITGAIDNTPFPAHLLVPVQASGAGNAFLSKGRYVIELNSEYIPEIGTNALGLIFGSGEVTVGHGTFRTPVSLALSANAITITAVPEPSTLALGLLGAFGGVFFLRRRLPA